MFILGRFLGAIGLIHHLFGGQFLILSRLNCFLKCLHLLLLFRQPLFGALQLPLRLIHLPASGIVPTLGGVTLVIGGSGQSFRRVLQSCGLLFHLPSPTINLRPHTTNGGLFLAQLIGFRAGD